MNRNELGPETDSAAVREHLLEEIAASGPITFRRFMEIVLYLPYDGYYASSRERIGAGGDYLTAPEISPLFGYAAARQLGELWRCMGAPERFDVLEAGAGGGALASDILRWTAARDAEFQDALRYSIADSSEASRGLQRERLSRWLNSGQLSIVQGLEQLEDGAVQGCILSNELLDSFPVHRVRVQDGGLHEIYVDVEGSHLVERVKEPSTPDIERYFGRLGLLPGEGCTAEVNLAMTAWLATAARTLRRGYVLTFDYGYPAERLYATWRRDGTLHCFYRHSAGDNPYVRLGRQDITTHVDLTTLVQSARGLGLNAIGLINQRSFLANLGIADAVTVDPASELATEEFYARRRAVSELLDPAGLGRVQVLLVGKDVPMCELTGFRGALTVEEALRAVSAS